MRPPQESYDLVPDGVVLGIQLCDGRLFEPKASRLKLILQAISHLASLTATSPKAVQTLLGMLTWHAWLARPLLSCFHEVYAFTALQPEPGLPFRIG